MQVLFTSRDRKSHEGFEKWTTRLKNNFLFSNPNSRPTKLKLVAISLPLAGYEFRSNVSTNFTVTESSAAVFQVQIPPGNYSAPELEVVITGLLNGGALSNTYTCLFNENTGIFSISRTAGTATFSLTWNHEELSHMLGFVPTTTGMAISHSGSFNYNISPPGFLILEIEGLKSIDTMENSKLNTGTFIIPTGNLSNLEIASVNGLYVPLTNHGLPDSITIALRRDNGVEYYDPRCDWSFVVQLE